MVYLPNYQQKLLLCLDYIYIIFCGNLPCRFLFVKCSFQDIFWALRSIRMYVPSSDFWCETFSVHDSDPYISTLSTVATKSLLLSG